ncbi:MAG: hypothetical protein Q7S02_00455, partial [bacterium]|nr:hypothetical protein [bacterium]
MDQDSTTSAAPETSTVKRAPPPKRPPVRISRPILSAHPLTPWAVTSAAVIVLAFVILGIIPTSLRSSRPWQSVFLTNGQVYFGHVVRQTLTTVTLRDVYYLQMSPSLQQRQPDQPPPPPDVTLVKLGTELHGPTDEMR